MTKAEKFKEVFGVEPDTTMMVIACPENLRVCKYRSEIGLCHCEEWWQEEYKGDV